MAFSAPDPGEERTTAGSTPPGPAPHTPWLAVLGAGDAAVTAVGRAVTEAFSAATSTQKTVQQRVVDLPAELDELRGRFSGDELRRALDAYRVQLERAYGDLAGRGEEAWERLRERPEVRQAITALESYTEKLDLRVDGLVDEAQDAATRAFAVAGRQTRVTGEKVARAGQRFSGRAASAVVEASATTADAVEDAGTSVAEVIEEAGEETATVTRKATRRTGADTTTPTPGPAAPGTRPAAPRRAPRRQGPTSG